MASNDDVPLGEGARKYYEEQFGARVNNIRKGGGPAPAGNSGGGSGWGGRAGGWAVVIIVIIALRVVFAAVRSSSSTPNPPTYHFDPPRFEVQPQVGDANRKLLEDLERMRRDQQRWQPPAFDVKPLAPDEAKPSDAPRFEEGDLPFAQGLCYRIHHESLQAGPSPGRRLSESLDQPVRDLIAQAAGARPLTRPDLDDLRLALNKVLDREDFINEEVLKESFRDVSLPHKVFELARGADGDDLGPAERTTLKNRLALEAAYPGQIVPHKQRPSLNDLTREQWLRRGRQDLEAARRQYEPGNP